MLDLNNYMSKYFEEVDPKKFYRDVFPSGELEEYGHREKNTGKYNAVAVEITKEKYANGQPKIRRHIITDDLERLDVMLESENFILMSPISYIGMNRTSENARFFYGIAIDLDGVKKEENMRQLFHQILKAEYLPLPTYVVTSGTGLHLYYLFKQPIPCFKNVVKSLAKLKKALTKKIWNGYVTELDNKVQFESVFQGFRLVGGITKLGDRTRCYAVGDKVDIEYLNGFVEEKDRATEIVYKSNLTKAQAKEKYPEWYEKRIEQKQPRGTWTCKRDLYEWWKKKILEGAVVGHRYYCIMCLAIYGKKCDVSREEIEKDIFEKPKDDTNNIKLSLFEYLERLTEDDENHFTEQDVLQALEMYNDNYFTFPIDSISELTDIKIEKNKRNYQKQAWHLEDIRSKKANMKRRGQEFKNPEGRPSSEKKVRDWKTQNPNGRKIDCIRETNLSKSTVYKWWNE